LILRCTRPGKGGAALVEEGLMQIYESTYEARRYMDGKRYPAFQQFTTQASATTWATSAGELTGEVPRSFDWQSVVPRDFKGLAIEEQRWLRDGSNGGQRTRVWCGSAYNPPEGMGKPIDYRPPSVTRESYVIRGIRLFDWIEVGTIGWQIAQSAGLLDELPNAFDFVAGKVVQDDESPCRKAGARSRSIEHTRHGGLIVTQGGSERCGHPVAIGHRRE
jgi:hypothetical protein